MTTPEETPVAETVAARVGVAQQLLVVRLATLHRIMQRSASMAYGRETGLRDFDWLVVSYIGLHASPPTASQVADRLMRDRGQISRTVTRLTEAGLLTRDHLRAPLQITKRGEKVYRRIERLMNLRNAALLVGVTDDDRAVLDAVLDKLFTNANALYASERRRAGERRDGDVERPGHGGDRWRRSDQLLMPDMNMLLRLLRKSANLAYIRVTGLSHFDWQTIMNVGHFGPLTLADLIIAMDRNKSQVGRAASRLEGQDLVDRRKEPGVASVVLSLTPKGRGAYDAIVDEAQRRDDALIENLTIREYRAFRSLLDRLTHNALGMLENERAIANRTIGGGAPASAL